MQIISGLSENSINEIKKKKKSSFICSSFLMLSLREIRSFSGVTKGSDVSMKPCNILYLDIQLSTRDHFACLP